MSASAHANGGLLRKPPHLPNFRDFAFSLTSPAVAKAWKTRPLGQFLRVVMARNMDNHHIFGPHETTPNKLDDINDQIQEPDVVMAACGDVPTLEALATRALLRGYFTDLTIRFVNVIDLFHMQSADEHPHGFSDRDLRQPIHHEQTNHLQFSRLSVAHSPSGLPVHQPRESAGAWI
jgi:phosphoketolase